LLLNSIYSFHFYIEIIARFELREENSFDIIIAGGGAAGLSLAFRLANSEFANLKIAIVDPEIKQGIDHTWCSWIAEDSIFDDCATNFFSKIKFVGEGINQVFDIAPYRYRMISSAEFYRVTNEAIDKSKYITRFVNRINKIEAFDDKAVVVLDNGTSIYGKNVIKSYIDDPKKLKETNKLYMDQHFKGLFIKTTDDRFDTEECTFMDFSIDQKGETRFMYVLPIDKRNALVEVAIFSNAILSHDEYDTIIKDYTENTLKIAEYDITDEEFGIIPMTVGQLEKKTLKNVTHIGTAGGGVKASTGFAFERIQRQCEAVVECIKSGNPINTDIFSSRFSYYDGTLLHVLLANKMSGKELFSSLFQKNKPQQLLKFLDDKTNFWEELVIMYSTNKVKFGTSFFSAVISK
jgi:lycopene beta-cyclase